MQVYGNTPLILIGHPDYQDPVWPITLDYIYPYWPNVSFGIPNDDETLINFHLYPIYPTKKPTGDVVVEITPELVDGKYEQRWSSRDFTEEERVADLARRKADILNQLDFTLMQTYGQGYLKNIAGKDENFSLTAENQMLMMSTYLLAKEEAADSERLFRMRTTENTIVHFTSAEMVDFGKGVSEYVQTILGKLWDLMEQTNAAQKHEDLPEVPPFLSAS